jgi:transposase
LILAIVVTPHRFRNKRQFWTCTGFAVIRRGSAEYEITQGELKRAKRKPLPKGHNNNYNRVLKNVLKGAALTAAYRGTFKKLFEERVASGMPPNLALLTLARIASITSALKQ